MTALQPVTALRPVTAPHLRRGLPSLLIVGALIGAFGAAACGPSAAQPTAAVTASPNAIYAHLSACDPLPDAIQHEPVEGLVMPDGMVVVDVRQTGPITAVTGFVDATPLDLREAFAGRPDVLVLTVEDEGFEAEVLVESGQHRTFLKATARCRTGSIVALVVAPTADGDRLPAPGGG